MDPTVASQRFRTALELFEAGVAIMRQNLRRRFPEAGEEEIAERLPQGAPGRGVRRLRGPAG